MALNIEDDEVERLAADIAQLTGETKTEASEKSGLTSRQISSIAASPATRKRKNSATGRPVPDR
jgi:hypothetical protein